MAKGYKKADLQNLPGCAAEFIKLVIKKMRYRKSVRADVQAELIAHFEDELRSYATDEEKQQKAQQLIDQFGDVKLLAVLLRRAKKRCRPLWRKVLVRGFQALGIIVVYFLICVSPLVVGTPNVSIDYIDWLNNLVRAGGDESNNALPYYKKATEACVKMPEQLYKIDRAWPADLNDVEIRMFLKWIDDNQQALELVRVGSKKPYCWPVYKATGTDPSKADTPIYHIDFITNLSLSGYRHIAKSLDWQSRYKAYKGDIESALNDCVVLLKFGCHFQGKGLLIEQLVGVAMEALAHNTILVILEKADVPADALKSVQQHLQKQFSQQEPVISLEAEKAFSYDYIQRTFTDDGEGSGRVLIKGIPFAVEDWKSGLWGFVSFSYPDRREVVAGVDRYFEQAAELFDKTPWDLHDAGITPERWDEILQPSSFMLRLLGPANSRVGQLSWRVKTSRAGLLTVLAVMRYEKEKGRYPARLDELVEIGYLDKVPMDPYSDETLVYKRTKEGFLLYSFGSNLTDDGGKLGLGRSGKPKMWVDTGDWVFWPMPKPEIKQ